MESYNWKAKPISPCLGAHEAHPKTTLYGVVFQKLNGPLLTSRRSYRTVETVDPPRDGQLRVVTLRLRGDHDHVRHGDNPLPRRLVAAVPGAAVHLDPGHRLVPAQGDVRLLASSTRWLRGMKAGLAARIAARRSFASPPSSASRWRHFAAQSSKELGSVTRVRTPASPSGPAAASHSRRKIKVNRRRCGPCARRGLVLGTDRLAAVGTGRACG